ncbi:J domain-containing protein [Tsukamurella sp. 8F]|uniref:J domain-containing protein n=1 Tax=unclassified Tsukamurella TaxID=2633480 RepID=UPI0023B8E37B|nr:MULTISPECIES: J domain-containing protein [unclassified Tsukamurella]MDF0528596.1 J domain-containing protein [Tsukamurella sp. 8J]MDF0585558.1 J domain-containing protein [Tsukamurella sp. 8F]
MPVGYQDYYEALGVPRDASEDDIRRAYRKLARTSHPDVNKEPGAEDRFKQISEAYEVLRDPEKRAEYDRFGANWRAGQDVSGEGGFGGAGFTGDVHFGDGGDFSDFFESLFGGGRGGRTRGGGPGFAGYPTRGADHEAELDLTLEEAAAGGHRHLSFADGRDYDVDVPKGVRDGQRIRLAGEGGPGHDGGPAGDLFLRARIAPHPRLRRDGDDLHVDVPVSPSEAALGADIPVPTLTGTVKVRVPAGSSSGRTLRVRGQGMPATRGATGSLFVHLKIVVPKHLDDEQRELYEKLAATRFDPREELI